MSERRDRWSVRTFITERRRKPVDEFIADQAPPVQAEIRQSIRLLEANGPNLAMPHARPVRGEIRELRARVRNDEYRVLYAHVGGRHFLLLHALKKTTEKLPDADWLLAERRLGEFRSRFLRRKG